MLAEDAFLRQMPRCLDKRIRIELQAVVTASDIIEESYIDLRNCLFQLKDELFSSQNISNKLVRVTKNCWSIVDQIHIIRQIVNSRKGEHGDLTKLFFSSTEVVHKMRNKMDHIHSNLDNMAKKKGAMHPLHGAVAFGMPNEDGVTAKFFVLPLSPQHEEEVIFPYLSPDDGFPQGEIDCVSFASFGFQFNISRTVNILREWLRKNNLAIEEDIIRSIRLYCKKNPGKDFDMSIAERVSGHVYMAFDISFEHQEHR